MKTIRTVYLRNLRNPEYYQFMLQVMSCFTVELKTKYKFTARYDALDDSMTLFEGIFNASKKAEETPEVQSADKARDAVFIGIKQLIKGFSHAGDPAQKAAAAKIQFMLDPYKNANAKGYEANSGFIHKFIIDVKEAEIYNYITMLNLNHQIDDLIALNNSFDDIYYKRGQAYAAADKAGKLREIRDNMNPSYRNLIEKVSALYLIADDDDDNAVKGEIGALVDKINAIIYQTALTISRHRSGVRIIVEDEENKDNDSDGPIEISGEPPRE
jgi:hypothetical protein